MPTTHSTTHRCQRCNTTATETVGEDQKKSGEKEVAALGLKTLWIGDWGRPASIHYINKDGKDAERTAGAEICRDCRLALRIASPEDMRILGLLQSQLHPMPAPENPPAPPPPPRIQTSLELIETAIRAIVDESLGERGL